MNEIMDNFAKYVDPQVISMEEIHKEIRSGTLQTSTMDSVLEAAASLFPFKIIVFRSDSGSLEFKVIYPTDTSESPPGEDNPRFQSLKFKLGRISKYDDLLTDHQGYILRENVGRVHLPTPYSGRGHLLLRSSKYHSISIATHVIELYSILKTKEDGGPDFSPEHVLNFVYYFRLFVKLNADMLCVSTYEAKYSAYNPIEHL